MNGKSRMAIWAVSGGVSAVAATTGTRLTLDLKGDTSPVERIPAKFRCDAKGAQLGLPEGIFTVTYINNGDNGLAIVPIHGQDRVFARVISANGGRYDAGPFEWWTAKETTFTDSMNRDTGMASCQSID